MTDLTGKFAALEEQMAAQAAAIQALVDGVESSLDLINAQLDTQTINNAANTRYLLSALGTLNPCTDCEGISITVPPTAETGVTIDEDLCKRIQAFLHAMTEVYTVLDTMSAFGVGFSTAILTDAFNTVITALENGDTTPLPSFPEMVQIVGDGVSYIATNVLVGHTLVGLFTPLYFDLIGPMYLAGSASASQAVYNSIIEGTGYSVFEKRLLQHSAYNALWSYYFDPASMPNLAGYDGTICVTPLIDIGECTQYTSTDQVFGPVTFQAIVPVPDVTYSWANSGDFFGWTVQMIVGAAGGDHSSVYSIVSGVETLLFSFGAGDPPAEITAHTTVLSIRTNVSETQSLHWTAEICPPA